MEQGKICYCMILTDTWNTVDYEWMRLISEKYEELIIALPDRTVVQKLLGKRNIYEENKAINFWKTCAWVSRVEIISEDLLSYQAAYHKFGFDACILGGKYGKRYQEDLTFFEENHIMVYYAETTNNDKNTELLSVLQKSGKAEEENDFCADFNAYIHFLERFEEYASSKRKDWEIMDKIHQINLDMLKEFDRICRKYQIKYFMIDGALLGAVRHHGMIPWDNDIDVVMFREDCEVLSQHIDEFSDKYKWVPKDDLGKKKYFDNVPRINYKKAYININPEASIYYENHNNRIDLDMFFIDRTYDNFRGMLQRKELSFVYGLLNAYRHKTSFNHYSPKLRRINWWLTRIGKLFSVEFLRKCADRIATRYDRDEKATHYFISNAGPWTMTRIMPREVFDRKQELDFEGMNVMVPGDYEFFLKTIFGDYMRVPPMQSRIPHWGPFPFTPDMFVFEEPESEK